MKILNENVSRNIMNKLNEDSNILNEIKQMFLDWAKGKDNLKYISFSCSFTGYYLERADFNSNEEMINKFFQGYIHYLEIITKRPYIESDEEHLYVRFKFPAYNGTNYKATGSITLK